ncbi:hypothetical protein FC83_GL002606 [Agrilactobacillus composti DSM 18527 = JCM 14202]|uniref:Zinc-ribbon domain-containing protein n=1 Tax=Agrilactobacillus composti DSM 18527 = JCM 14202 TaxID=1423734 RepID=X0PHU1_9LACO|nr:DUF805 domain-containing protein [Agrilactobacillus composti]KRM36731.1 hypothetical protein FC83_GL002606 [Agrilactobacillus composti DSM 18527 = JCM 14202]GAF41588.1 hypothetical protein JCM14202_3538 [Agrilactobacillus composti DSM 18527 = JCM 14202]
MKFCQNCGKQVLDMAKFCPYCGAKIAEATSNANMSNRVSPDSRISGNNISQQNSTTNQADYNRQQQNFSQQDTSREANQGMYSNTYMQPEMRITDPNQPQLGFLKSVGYVFKHTFEFGNGPAESRKSIYWWFTLAVSLIQFFSFLVYCVDEITGGIFFLLLAVVVFLPNISAMMRRLKFLGHSPYLAWLAIIPVGNIVMLIFMLQSNPRPIRYN